ncbi:MAG: hypothetical protein AB8I08_07765 [Sandaracinaceae bacterium]
MSFDALAGLTVDGFRLTSVNSDAVDGVVVSLTDPAVEMERWHIEGAHHVLFPEWAYLVFMRPCFVPLRAFSVRASPDFVAEQLGRMPPDWFSDAERQTMQRVSLFDRELALPVLELIAPAAEVRRGPLRVL